MTLADAKTEVGPCPAPSLVRQPKAKTKMIRYFLLRSSAPFYFPVLLLLFCFEMRREDGGARHGGQKERTDGQTNERTKRTNETDVSQQRQETRVL